MGPEEYKKNQNKLIGSNGEDCKILICIPPQQTTIPLSNQCSGFKKSNTLLSREGCFSDKPVIEWMHYSSLKEKLCFALLFPGLLAWIDACVRLSTEVVLLWMTWAHVGERLLQTDVGCAAYFSTNAPREQAFSILSTGHGVERVNSAALIDQSGFSRWIQFWIIFSSMVNFSLLSKYIRLIGMSKGSTLGYGMCTSVWQVVCATFTVWW